MATTHITNLEELLDILNTANRWVQYNIEFLVVNDGTPYLYIWAGVLEEASTEEVPTSLMG